MILNHIILRNFCLYRGEQVFDLSPTIRAAKPSPIVLCGGINGGGKTTLLDAVQLVLYGMRGRCSKRGEKAYDTFLRESIHHGADPSEGAAIQIAFRYAEEGQEHLYEVCRSWSDIRGRIRENVQVSRNGEVDAWLSDNWNQAVEELIPYGIAQLCFFDAEQIRFIAEDDSSTEALGTAVKSLLGLDLVERLVTDAGVLEGRLAKRASKSVDLEEVERMEADLEVKESQILRLVQERGAVENPRLLAHKRVQLAEQRFAKLGGQHWKQRESREIKKAEIQHALKGCEEQLVSLAATETPLLLVTHLLRDAATQADRELQTSEASVIGKLLGKRDAELLKILKRKQVDRKAVEVVEEYLANDRTERMSQHGVDARLELSEGGRRALEYLLNRGLAEKSTSAKEQLAKVESARRTLEDLERDKAATPDVEEVREITEELKIAVKESTSLDQQANRLDKELDIRKSERTELKTRLSNLRRKVVDEVIQGEQNSRMADLLVRTQDTMKTFLRRATTAKIDRLSGLITESFRFLLRKETLVQRVLIDPESFAITLFDNTGLPISKQRLSEGEKQIFAIAVLWGLSRAANRPFPAIIDTPMARLDSEHRSHLVERYFPNASHQVVILSTDTEIDRDYFLELQPHIARSYHLNYDEDQKMTVAEEGYFWEATSEAELEEVPT